MPRIPRINPGGIKPPAGPGNPTLQAPSTELNSAVVGLGQAGTNAAVRVSNQQLREARFSAAVEAKANKAYRVQKFNRALFNVNKHAFDLQMSFLEDNDAPTLTERTEKAMDSMIKNFGSEIDDPSDQQAFQLRAQSLREGLVLKAREVSLKKVRDEGLARGLELEDQILRNFSQNPDIPDDEFAGAVDSMASYYRSLRDNHAIGQTEYDKARISFDDRLGKVVRQQDETAAVESGSHFKMIQYLLRVQNGFYRINPEDVPATIDAAIKRQSTYLKAEEDAENKAVAKKDKDFRTALILEDAAAISELLGRPVTEKELKDDMRGITLEAFHAGGLISPETAKTADAEVQRQDREMLEQIKAKVTENIVKAEGLNDIEEAIDDLISQEGTDLFNAIDGGPAARRELLKEALTRKDKLAGGSEDFDPLTKRELALAEEKLDSFKTVGFLKAIGTKSENIRIANLKNILYFRTLQGAKPLDVLADLEKEIGKTPFKAAAEIRRTGKEGDTIIFQKRIEFLLKTAGETATDADDRELMEMQRIYGAFVDETKRLVYTGLEDDAAREAEEERKRLEGEESTINQLKKFFGIGE